MKRKQLLAATVSIATLALFQLPPAAAAEGAAKVDLARAKQIVDTVCAACHGADGNSVASVNPNLAGQGAEYITRQLQHFKSGVRANPMMTAMVGEPHAGRHGGAWESTSRSRSRRAEPRRIPRSSRPDSRCFAAGSRPPGLPACASCHSPNGAGIPRNYPRLAGQHADYAYAQLKAFKSGERGADKDGKDVQGRIMAAIAQKMSDAQMKAVADYTAGLR